MSTIFELVGDGLATAADCRKTKSRIGTAWLRTAAAASLATLAAARAEELTIVRGNRPEAAIVVSDPPLRLEPMIYGWDGSSFDTKYAAQVLQSNVFQVTGALLPIVSEQNAPLDKTLLLIGGTKLGERFGITADGLPPEGYRIRSFDRGIAIVGEVSPRRTDRGTLFGVYDFLSHNVGARVYFPGPLGAAIPQRDTITVATPVNREKAPFFRVRYGGLGYGDDFKAWHAALRYGVSDGLIANHTEESWRRLYGTNHPEYFGRTSDGRSSLKESRYCLCYTEPGVFSQMLANIEGYLERGDATPWQGCSAQPMGRAIPFGGNDTEIKCACARCSAAIAAAAQRGRKRAEGQEKRYGWASDYIHGFSARLATAMKQRWPDARLWALAYQGYELPPLDPAVSIPDNYAVTLCLLPTSVQMNQPDTCARNLDLIDQWHKLLGRDPRRLIVWDYFIYPNSMFCAPTEFPHIYQKLVRHLKPRALGIFNNGLNPRDGARYYLTYYMVWIMHQLLWDPDADVDALRRQYCEDLFGPASAPMLEFYGLLEKRWETVVWSRSYPFHSVAPGSIYGETYPSNVVVALKSLLNAAENASGGGIYRDRVRWFRASVFGPFFDAADAAHEWSQKPPPQLDAYRAPGPVAVDGVLSESAWKDAEWVSFRHYNAMAPVEPSRAASTWDSRNLYFAAVLSFDPARPPRKAATNGTQETFTRDDQFVVHLKPTAKLHPFDQRGHLEIVVNGRGAFRAAMVGSNETWSPTGLTAGARSTTNELILELACPWDNLFNNPGAGRMRAQFLRRYGGSRLEYDCWSPTFQQDFYPELRFGWLSFSEERKRRPESPVKR